VRLSLIAVLVLFPFSAIAQTSGEPIVKTYALKYAPPQSTADEITKRFPSAKCIALPSANSVIVYAEVGTQFAVQQWLADFEELHGPTTPQLEQLARRSRVQQRQ